MKKLYLKGTPTEKQQQLFDSRAKYTAYGGARGGGKSWALRRKLVLMCFHYPGLRCLLIRRSYPELQHNHILTLRAELGGAVQYSELQKRFIFPNGSSLKMGYLSCDGDTLQYQGLERDVPGNEDIILEVSPAVAAKIIKAKILNGTDNTDVLDKGCVGTFMGFRVYVSNNIKSATETTTGSTTGTFYKCFARTKRAITFAEQLNEIEAYRPELRFADAVKGLHLYGAKIVYPKELMLLNVNLGTDA